MAGGLWSRTHALLAQDPAKARSVREIADAVDAEPFEVRSILGLKAKAGLVVRVVSAAPGPLLWRLTKGGSP